MMVLAPVYLSFNTSSEIEEELGVGEEPEQRLSRALIDFGRFESAYPNGPRGSDTNDCCTVCLVGGDSYLVALSIEVIEGIVASVGHEITDLSA